MGKGRTVSTRKRTTLIATAVCLELVAVFLYSMAPVSAGEVVTPTHNVSNVAPTPSPYLAPLPLQGDKDHQR